MENPTKIRIPNYNYYEQTEKAYCLMFGTEKVWLPKSQIRDWEMVGEDYVFWIAGWLIPSKKLEKYVDTSHEPMLPIGHPDFGPEDVF
jgi:hypothetical protein